MNQIYLTNFINFNKKNQQNILVTNVIKKTHGSNLMHVHNEMPCLFFFQKEVLRSESVKIYENYQKSQVIRFKILKSIYKN